MTNTFSYDFSWEELKCFVQIMRKNPEKIPRELFSFFRAVQQEVYNSLSVDEVERLFK